MSAEPPNIVICLCDQLRAFEVGCYGNEVIRTPHIDRLASEGVRFETAVTNCAVCMPARSVLLSGQYSRTCCGTLNNAHEMLPSGGWVMQQYPAAGRPHIRDTCLPETLQELGYETAAIGKWHIHSWPHDLGFDYSLVPRVYHGHTGQSFSENGGREFVPEGFSVDFEAERVGEFLRGRCEGDPPFFLYHNISPPHPPLADAPEKYLKMYHPDEVPIRPNAFVDGQMAHNPDWYRIYLYDQQYYWHHLPFTDNLPEGFDLRHLTALYYGMTTWVDDTLGKLMAELEEAGLAENTIVLFASDHGDNLGGHGRWNKNTLNEEATRIPFILRWPAALRPRVPGQQVASLVDVMPTLLDLLGADIPDRVQGQSLAPVVRGEREALERDAAFIESNVEGIAIRTPSLLFGMQTDRGTREITNPDLLLYDLGTDPYQQENLARTERSSQAEPLRKELAEWHRRTPWMRN